MQEQFHHPYISPLEACNLNCRMCYTKKTSTVLTNRQILDFIKKYHLQIGVKSVTFCGGEVFLLKDFPKLVNQLTARGFFIQIITNGTIDRLEELKNPNSLNLIVSIDGLQTYHDQNRGPDRFKQSFNFLKKARAMGFYIEVFTIVTQENLKDLDDFEKLVKVPVTYHPRKPLGYLKNHPVSNVLDQTKGFSFLTKLQLDKLARTKKIFPPLNFGCYGISLMSDGLIYGCCEGITALGKIGDSPKKFIVKLINRIDVSGCAEPQFKCGLNSNPL